jgi:peptidylprolyl isomerase
VVFGQVPKGDTESMKVVRAIEAVGSSSGATKFANNKDQEPHIVGCGQN